MFTNSSNLVQGASMQTKYNCCFGCNLIFVVYGEWEREYSWKNPQYFDKIALSFHKLNNFQIIYYSIHQKIIPIVSY